MKKVLSLSPRFSVAAIRSFAASLSGAVFFLAILPVLGHALTPGQVFDKVKDSVVVVKILDAQGKVKGQGSGVILPSGKVATNCHVVEEGASYQVGRGKRLVSAILYAEDGDKDVCLLDAKGIEGKPVQFGTAVGLKVGDTVYAVGAPQGLELSLSDGIVAQLRGSPSPLIQTTAAISPGSSGGGLFDREGRLVGLTTFYVEGGQSLNFAMPVEWIGEVKPGRKLAAEGHSQTEWLKRSIALEKSKDWPGLLDWSRKWTKSEPKNAFAWYSLGNAYGGLERHNDAVEAYRQGLSIDPEYVFAWYNLGYAYGGLKRYDEAIEAIRQALRIDPKLAQAWYNLGYAYALSGNRTAALDAVRELRRLDPAQADELFNLIVPRAESMEKQSTNDDKKRPESNWVLWMKATIFAGAGNSIGSKINWDILYVAQNKPDCEKRYIVARGLPAFQNTKKQFYSDGTWGETYYDFYCLPETIDPRDKNTN